MIRTGTLDTPLHSGKAPRWLFEKMVSLGRRISEIMLIESGPDFFLQRLSDPFWFQSFGCVLGFDWHSSGVTTTVCGALKEAFRQLPGAGIYICGGKGAASRRTPSEIESYAYTLAKAPDALVHASRMSAKVDNTVLQDGFTLYHHTFIFTADLRWAVIQQGMSDEGGWARRYHWYSQNTSSFVKEPHTGIATDISLLTLNLVDTDREKLRTLITQLSRRIPRENIADITALKEESRKMPSRHKVLLQDVHPQFLDKIFLKTYETHPLDFAGLVALAGIGPKTLRALALIADLIYGESISFKDPARFSFAHGGKDGFPYRINAAHYQKTIDILNKAVNKAKIDYTDKLKALRRLHAFYNTNKNGKVHRAGSGKEESI